MALNKEPILKRCRYLGISPMVMGISKESNRNPGANNRRKVSEYGTQLKEKQKLKFIYGVLEKPFHHYLRLLPRWRARPVITLSLSSSPVLTMLFTEWALLLQEEKQDSSLLTDISL